MHKRPETTMLFSLPRVYQRRVQRHSWRFEIVMDDGKKIIKAATREDRARRIYPFQQTGALGEAKPRRRDPDWGPTSTSPALTAGCHASTILVLLVLCFRRRPCMRKRPAATPTSFQKSARAVRIANDSSAGWDSRCACDRRSPYSDWTQKEPIDVEPATQRWRCASHTTAMRCMWGEHVRRDAASIQAQLGRAKSRLRRSSLSRSTRTTIGAPLYFRRERVRRADGPDLADDRRESADAGFDAVWEAKTSVDGQGWSAELWIPFAQLRFNAGNEQVWGLNIGRFTPTLDEEVYWVVVPRTVRAWASRFGVLQGIDGVRPRRRIECSPSSLGRQHERGPRSQRSVRRWRNLLGVSAPT